jgi:hypothetical protein
MFFAEMPKKAMGFLDRAFHPVIISSGYTGCQSCAMKKHPTEGTAKSTRKEAHRWVLIMLVWTKIADCTGVWSWN